MADFEKLQGQGSLFDNGIMVDPKVAAEIMQLEGVSIIDRVAVVGMEGLNPEGLAFGMTPNGDLGVGHFANGGSEIGDTTIQWNRSLTAGVGQEGLSLGANIEVSRQTDLGSGHTINLNGAAGISTEHGLRVHGAFTREWNNPSEYVDTTDLVTADQTQYGDIGFQSWSIEAGAIGSNEGLSGAVIGEVTYGNDLAYGFGRAAIGFDEGSLDRSAEVGVGVNMDEFDTPLLKNVTAEIGVRAGETPIHGGSSSGQGPFAGIGMKLDF